MSNNKHFQIAFMPYAPLQENLKIGNYEVWQFNNDSSKRIADKKVLKQIKNYFNRYNEYVFSQAEGGIDKNLETINIITPMDFVVGEEMLTEKHILNIRSIAHILSFSSIFETGFGANSSDPFQTIVQSFVQNQEGMTVWTKYYTRYNLFKILKPLHINSPFLPYKLTNLATSLGNALEARETNIIIKQIFNCLELIFHTITFGEMVTDFHRTLTLLMAFEVLLGFENKKKFVEQIEKYIEDPESVLVKRMVNLPGGKKKEFEKSKTCWWAYDLYNLRNQIIHGEEVDWKLKEYGDIWIRIKFAGSILKRIFKIMLTESDYFKNDVMERIIEAHSMDETFEDIIKEFLDLNPELE
jgi:hypothetical protein